jgi:hypothetical protein
VRLNKELVANLRKKALRLTHLLQILVKEQYLGTMVRTGKPINGNISLKKGRHPYVE